MSRLRGRFGDSISDEMAAFSSSLATDMRLARQDVEGSLAHAAGLADAGLIDVAEADALRRGLESILVELRDESWIPDPGFDDLHMAIESRLIEKVGDVGKKLHTARSRNDQVATDVRLWLRAELTRLDGLLARLIGTMLDRIETDGRTLLPGYTHLQRGQPVLLGHHLLAHTWTLARDRERMADARRRADRSPLGACAMAGTPHPIDRRRTAERLGFSAVVENAMDAVSARDHLQETAAACAICMCHLSRMAEELVLWSSQEFGFVRMAAAYATGSSIMPQKRNPDAAELVRGKSARVFGDLQALLVMVKALPLAYNRDLQEDKEPLFDAVDTTGACLSIMANMWAKSEIVTDRFDAALSGDFSLATELADFLAGQGVPFREAHEVVARLVSWCEGQGLRLDQIPSGDAARFHPALAGDLRAWLDPRAAAERRTSLGGTAWSEVRRQVALLRGSL